MTQPLGSAITISKGKKHEVIESPSGSAKRLIGIDDLRNDDLLRYTDDRKGVESVPEDVLIAWDGANAGTIGYGKSGFIGSTIARLRIKPESKLFTPFLGLFLKSKFGYLRKTATGATIPHINRKALEGIPLPNAEFNDQIRIAHLLGKVEGLIAQRKQHLQQLDDLLKSVFLEMFGDDIRDESSYSPITTVCDFIDYRGKTPPRVEIGVPLISAKCVRSGYFDSSRLDFVTEKTYKKIMTRGFPKPNDVLFTTEGATFGFTCRVPRDFKRFSVGQRLITMQCKDGYQPEVLEFVLNNQHIQKKLASRLSGSAALGIRSAELVKVTIPFPDQAKQLRFSSIVKKVEGLKSCYQQSLTDLESLYGALSQQAFKGGLDLSRVPLPASQPDTEATAPAELFEVPDEEHLAINLPDTDHLLVAFSDSTLRHRLLSDWLGSYCQQIGNTPFSASDFLAAAQTRIAELHPDNEFELGLDDYDQIKNWVFEALQTETLEQQFDDENNRVQLKPRQTKAQKTKGKQA